MICLLQVEGPGKPAVCVQRKPPGLGPAAATPEVSIRVQRPENQKRSFGGQEKMAIPAQAGEQIGPSPTFLLSSDPRGIG